MAENTRRYGQSAVYGSLAYDFNNPALNPEYTEEEQWQVMHRTDNPVAEETQAAELAVAGNRQALAPVSVLGILAAAVMIVVMLLAQARLTAVCNDAVRLTNRINQLQTEQARLRIAFESAFNLTEIEDYAVSELGMQKPRNDQIFSINSRTQDKVEIFTPDSSGSLLDRVTEFTGSVKEYLG
ncbi:MAG: cell division protein FtsL [Oscillospiraceae bacterium]|nr:cell division protein FtsL [Oscillospiraceae bacterium]